MNTLPIAIHAFLGRLLACEEGQDLVEYSLILGMIAFGSVTGMGSVATGLNNAFSLVATTLTANT